MSGECETCGEHCLDCICYLTLKRRTFSRCQENALQYRVSNATKDIIPFLGKKNLNLLFPILAS